MPKKKETGGRTPSNPRTAIVLAIMADFEILIPPVESGKRDGFEHVDHPQALKDLWKVANRFPSISTNAADADKRRKFYADFKLAVKFAGGFRKGGFENAKLWDRIQTNLKKLEATG